MHSVDEVMSSGANDTDKFELNLRHPDHDQHTTSSIETDHRDNRSRLRKYQMQIFFALYFTYAACYVGRQSFASLSSFVIKTGFSLAQTGTLGSSLAVGYSLGRIVATFAIDEFSPVKVFPMVVLCVGIVNFLFSITSSFWILLLLWTFNGALHGISWMPVTQIITKWYPQKERGLWWGLLSTCSTLTSAFVQVGFPFLCEKVFNNDWRTTMMVMSIFPMALGIACQFFIKESPESVGLSLLSQKNKDKQMLQEPLTSSERLSLVMKNKGVQMLSISAFFVYVTRSGITNWLALYLVNVSGFTPISAGSVVFFFELGGIVGCTTVGWISDRFFNSRRAPPNVICSFSAAAVILLIPMLSNIYLINLCTFIFGAFLYGPQTFIGMHVVELVDTRTIGTAMGYNGLFCGLGSIVAGFPLGTLIDLFGWQSLPLSCFVSCIISGVVVLPLYNHTARKSDK